MGGKLHPRLINITGKPIANKYREGKLKRTPKRGLKEPEVAEEKGQQCLMTCRSGDSSLVRIASVGFDLVSWVLWGASDSGRCPDI